MTRNLLRSIAVVSLAALLLGTACHRGVDRGAAPAQTTQTVAPAAAQPSPTGTDAMTQTVDVGDGRSEEDGGASDRTATTRTPPQVKAGAKPPLRKH